MRWRGPCPALAASGRPVAWPTQYRRPTTRARHPRESPVSRLLPRPRGDPGCCPPLAVDVFLRRQRPPRKPPQIINPPFPLSTNVSTEPRRLSARNGGYPLVYSQPVHRSVADPELPLPAVDRDAPPAGDDMLRLGVPEVHAEHQRDPRVILGHRGEHGLVLVPRVAGLGGRVVPLVVRPRLGPRPD